MSNQGLRQASVRAVTGTTGTYQDDWHALFTSAGIAAGDFNGRLLAWINDYLGTTIANVNDAMQAFAVDQGFASWSSMGTFDAGGFEGILDTLATTAAGAWSVARRLTADYEGDLIRLRRDSDNAESDFGYDGDGVLDAAAVATWIGGSSGLVVTIYDQIGTQNITTGTAANQPAYGVVAGINSRGAAVAADGGDRLTANLSANWSGNQNHCLLMVGRTFNSDLGAQRMAVTVGNSSFSSCIGSNGSVWWYGGSFLLGANNSGGTSDSSYHYFTKRHASGTTTFRVDGSQIESAANTYNFSGTTAANFGGDGLTGGNTQTVAEFIAFSQDIANGDQTAWEADAATFYGL